MTAADQMHMNMEHFLTAVAVAVHYQAVAVIRNPFLLRDFGCHGDHMTQNLFIFRSDIIHGRNKMIGNNQNMRRCLRGNITERRDAVILINDIRRNFTTNNFTKNSFFGHNLLL